jgi:uncharacterized protein DUF4388
MLSGRIMTARIFNLNDDERFVRAPFEEPETSPFESFGGSGLSGEEGFSGAISLPLLPDLIQIYTTSMASGALTIRHGADLGTIWFDRGAMVHAVCGEEVGEAAVYRLLQWHDGKFSLDTAAQAPFQSITSSWQKVLMEGCRRLDEETRGTAVPFPETAFTGEMEAVLSDISGAIEGLLAVSVFDSLDGALIAQRSLATDLTSAGPAIAEMFRQQMRIMTTLDQPPALLDCFSIFGDEVHFLTPLPRARLLYLAVKRDSANLAVVRRVVEHACGRLS